MEFKQFNANPKQWKREGDCVVRALCVALDQTWEETYKELFELGLKKCTMPNSKSTYEAYLKQKGWIKNKMPRHDDGSRYTIRQLAKEYPTMKAVVSVANHLTYLEYGTLIDTWDCSMKSVGNYWTKGGEV